MEKRVENYIWIGELGNRLRTLPPVYVNEEVGFAKLKVLADDGVRIVLLCAEKDENRCHRKYVKEKLVEMFKHESKTNMP